MEEERNRNIERNKIFLESITDTYNAAWSGAGTINCGVLKPKDGTSNKSKLRRQVKTQEILHKVTHRITANELDDLKKKWLGRSDEIARTVELMYDESNACPPIIIQGPPSTGKTKILRDIIDQTESICAFIDCCQVYSAKELLQSIVDQLKNIFKLEDETISVQSWPKFMRGINRYFLNAANKAGSSSDSPLKIFIILDRVDYLSQSWSPDVLQKLMNLSRCLYDSNNSMGSRKGPQIFSVTSICITNRIDFVNKKLSNGKSILSSTVHPIHLTYRAYSKEELIAIILSTSDSYQHDLHDHEFKPFIEYLLEFFYSSTVNLIDIQRLIEEIWPKYCDARGLDNGINSESVYSTVKRLCKPMRSHFYQITPGRVQQNYPREIIRLSTSANFMLIAGYLATEIPEKLDVSVFTPKSLGPSRKKQKLHHSKIPDDKRDVKKNGISFERLLAIYSSLRCSKGMTVSNADSLGKSYLYENVNNLVKLGIFKRCENSDIDVPRYKFLADRIAVHEAATRVDLNLDIYLRNISPL